MYTRLIWIIVIGVAVHAVDGNDVAIVACGMDTPIMFGGINLKEAVADVSSSVTVVEKNTCPAGMNTTLDDLLVWGTPPRLIIALYAHLFVGTAELLDIATANTATKFILLQTNHTFRADNIQTVFIRMDQEATLAGLLSASVSQTGKIQVVVGNDDHEGNTLVAAFGYGVQEDCPSCSTNVAYVGTADDSSVLRGALSDINSGVDTVYIPRLNTRQMENLLQTVLQQNNISVVLARNPSSPPNPERIVGHVSLEWSRGFSTSVAAALSGPLSNNLQFCCKTSIIMTVKCDACLTPDSKKEIEDRFSDLTTLPGIVDVFNVQRTDLVRNTMEPTVMDILPFGSMLPGMPVRLFSRSDVVAMFPSPLQSHFTLYMSNLGFGIATPVPSVIPRGLQLFATSSCHETGLGFIHGGTVGDEVKCDVYEIDWTCARLDCAHRISARRVETSPPLCRFAHSSAWFDRRMYVFGGLTRHQTTSAELWRLDTRDMTWVRLADGNVPRSSFAMMHMSAPAGFRNHPNASGVIFAHGGIGTGGPIKDFEMYFVDTNQWTRLPTPPTSPTPRQQHCLFPLGNDRVGLVGGVGTKEIYSFTHGPDKWNVVVDDLPTVVAPIHCLPAKQNDDTVSVLISHSAPGAIINGVNFDLILSKVTAAVPSCSASEHRIPSVTSLSCQSCPASQHAVNNTCRVCSSEDSHIARCATDSGLSAVSVALIVVLPLALIGSILGAAAFYRLVWNPASSSISNAPTADSIPICICHVKDSAKSWRTNPKGMTVATNTYINLVQRTVGWYSAYKVKITGDVCVIVGKKVSQVVKVANALREGIQSTAWSDPSLITVSVVVHYGRVNRREEADGHISYSGDSILRAIQLAQSISADQVVMTQEAFEVHGEAVVQGHDIQKDETAPRVIPPIPGEITLFGVVPSAQSLGVFRVKMVGRSVVKGGSNSKAKKAKAPSGRKVVAKNEEPTNPLQARSNSLSTPRYSTDDCLPDDLTTIERGEVKVIYCCLRPLFETMNESEQLKFAAAMAKRVGVKHQLPTFQRTVMVIAERLRDRFDTVEFQMLLHDAMAAIEETIANTATERGTASRRSEVSSDAGGKESHGSSNHSSTSQ